MDNDYDLLKNENIALKDVNALLKEENMKLKLLLKDHEDIFTKQIETEDPSLDKLVPIADDWDHFKID